MREGYLSLTHISLWRMKVRVRSPICQRRQRTSKVGHLSLTHAATWQTRRQDQLSHSRALSASLPVSKVSSIMLPRRTLSPECCSQRGAGPVLPSTAASEEWGQFSAALSSRTLKVTGATNINTDHDCHRAMDPGMALDSFPDRKHHYGSGWQAGQPTSAHSLGVSPL